MVASPFLSMGSWHLLKATCLTEDENAASNTTTTTSDLQKVPDYMTMVNSHGKVEAALAVEANVGVA